MGSSSALLSIRCCSLKDAVETSKLSAPMNRKATVGRNLVWASVCVAAFFFGRGGGARTGGTGHARGDTSAGAGEGSRAPLSALRPASADRGGGDVGAGGAGRALTVAFGDPDPLRCKARITDILINLDPSNVAGVLAAFEDGPRDEESDRYFHDFLYAWGRMAGADAYAYASGLGSARLGLSGSHSAISGWAASDPEAAKAFVAGVENLDIRQWLHRSVMREILRSDLDGAIAYSEQNEGTQARVQQIEWLARAIAERRGADGLAEWVAGIDHGNSGDNLLDYKRRAVDITLSRIAAEDPDAAIDWITENAGQPYLTADGLKSAARGTGGMVDEQLDWLVRLPSVEGRTEAVGELFRRLTNKDFERSGEWLAAQPLDSIYDEAIMYYVAAIQDYARQAARDDRQEALAWAERINDPDLRGRMIRQLRQAQPPRQS